MADKKMQEQVQETQRGGSTGTLILGALFGALAGAAAALLMAPRSGEETQEEIRRRGEELRSVAEERLNEGRDTAKHGVRKARTTVADWLDQGSSLLGEQADHLRENEVEERIPAA